MCPALVRRSFSPDLTGQQARQQYRRAGSCSIVGLHALSLNGFPHDVLRIFLWCD
jgi:hypothetical protein